MDRLRQYFFVDDFELYYTFVVAYYDHKVIITLRNAIFLGLSAAIISISILVTPAHAGLIDKLKSKFDSELRETVSSAAEGAREQASLFTGELFRYHVNPTLDRIDDMIAGGISETDARVKARIEDVERIVEGVLEAVRGDFIPEIDRIRRDAIDELTELQATIITDVQCSTEALLKDAQARFEQVVDQTAKRFLPARQDARTSAKLAQYCLGQLGMLEPPKAHQVALAYQYRACVEVHQITLFTPSTTIQSTQADLARFARTSQCAFRATGQTGDIEFSKDILHHQKAHELWSWVNSISAN